MQPSKRWIVLVLMLIVGLQIASCTNTPTGASYEPPSKTEKIEGSDFNLLTLTEKAVERLALEMAPIREQRVDGVQRMVIPYAAVVYGNNGETWAYVSPEPLKFQRVEITIDSIDGDMAILSDGPEVGTEVVTVGVPLLYGADTGVGK